MFENLLEQNISLQVILESPWATGAGLFLFWYIGGKVYRNIIVKRWLKNDISLNEYNYFAEMKYRTIAHWIRFLFPLSLAVGLVVMPIKGLLGLFGHLLESENRSLHELEEKHRKKDVTHNANL